MLTRDTASAMHALPPDPPSIVGRALVVDGDTLEIHGQLIRLWGIDAPEGQQTCMRAGAAYRCGTDAASYLARQVNDRIVFCQPEGQPDRYRRIVVKCSFSLSGVQTSYKQGIDLGAVMVAAGWAVDFPRYSSGRYAVDQSAAQRRRDGVWAGEFQMPWEWRSREP